MYCVLLKIFSSIKTNSFHWLETLFFLFGFAFLTLQEILIFFPNDPRAEFQGTEHSIFYCMERREAPFLSA